jgi:isopentenyl phosphate kinase
MLANPGLVFIKLGGSLLTDKTQAFSVRYEVLKRIAYELVELHTQGVVMVIGHGAGSFAHTPAKKYGTKEGLKGTPSEWIFDRDGKLGLVETAAAARQLNGIVTEALFQAGLPAVSLSPMSMMTGDGGQLGSISIFSLRSALKCGVVPVVYGDVVFDSQIGCTIFSTETVFEHLCDRLQNEEGQKIKQIIHCGQTDGVYGRDGQTIPTITTETWKEVMEVVDGAAGTDVTGGMEHKISHTITMAEAGVTGLIINGLREGELVAAVLGKAHSGTKIIK